MPEMDIFLQVSSFVVIYIHRVNHGTSVGYTIILSTNWGANYSCISGTFNIRVIKPRIPPSLSVPFLYWMVPIWNYINTLFLTRLSSQFMHKLSDHVAIIIATLKEYSGSWSWLLNKKFGDFYVCILRSKHILTSFCMAKMRKGCIWTMNFQIHRTKIYAASQI